MTFRVGHPHRLRALGTALALVATSLALVVPSLPAGAAGNNAWSIYPTSVQGQTVREFFQPILTPDSPYHDSVTIANLSADPESFNLYAADAFNAPNGGAYSLKTQNQRQTGMGAWINLPVSSVSLAARSYEVVPFTISVPLGATPGDHPGGIVLEPKAGSIANQGNLHVTILNAVGVRVYGRVGGKTTSSLAVTHLSANPKTTVSSLFGGPTSSTVTFTVANTGSTLLTPNATVSLSPLLGSSAGTRTIKLPQLLPQNSATFTVPFKSVIPFGGLSSSVHVSAPGAVASGSNFTLVIPWLLLAVIVLIVALLIWRRRRRKKAAALEDGGEPFTGERVRHGRPTVRSDVPVGQGAKSGAKP